MCSTSAVTSGEGIPLPPHEIARRRDQGMGSPQEIARRRDQGMGSPRTHC